MSASQPQAFEHLWSNDPANQKSKGLDYQEQGSVVEQQRLGLQQFDEQIVHVTVLASGKTNVT